VTNNTKLFSPLTWIHYWLYLIGGVGMGAFDGMAGLRWNAKKTPIC